MSGYAHKYVLFVLKKKNMIAFLTVGLQVNNTQMGQGEVYGKIN